MAGEELPALPAVQPPEEMPERYYDLYCAAALMHRSTRADARAWFAAGIPAPIAGAWARHGFSPEVGYRWMCADWTPEQVARLDEEARQQA